MRPLKSIRRDYDYTEEGMRLYTASGQEFMADVTWRVPFLAEPPEPKTWDYPGSPGGIIVDGDVKVIDIEVRVPASPQVTPFDLPDQDEYAGLHDQDSFDWIKITPRPEHIEAAQKAFDTYQIEGHTASGFNTPADFATEQFSYSLAEDDMPYGC